MKHKSTYQPGSLYKTARHWNLRAEEMQALAEGVNDPTVRRMMLRIAADYNWLAEKADDRAARDSIMFKRNVEYDPHTTALDTGADEPKQALA